MPQVGAHDFALTARKIYEQSITRSVPYLKGGETISGMDSGGFIEYCLIIIKRS